MTTTSLSIPSGFVKKNIKRIVNHWVVVSLTLSASGALFGFVILSTYLNAIGLPDLFPSALDTKTALVPWMILVALLLIFYMFMLTLNSGIFASGVGLFSKQPYAQTTLVRALSLPVLVGITLQMSGIVWELDLLLTFLGSLIGGMAVLGALMCSEKFGAAIHVAGFMTAKPEMGAKWQAKFGALFPLSMVVFGTVVTAVLPVQVALSTYPTPTDFESTLALNIKAIVVSLLALVPAFTFFAFGKNLLIKMRNTLAVLIVMIAAVLTLAPRTFPAMVYRTAYFMGLRDTTVNAYLITDTYSADDFDAGWGHVTTVKDRPIVTGFPLFKLGDLLILCPANLAGVQLTEWPKKSRACLVTDTKTAKRLPEKQAKKRWEKVQMFDV